MVLIDVPQAALLADPLELPLELLQFQCLQSLDFFAFLEEFFLFTRGSTFSRFLPRRVLATDGGGEVTWVTGDFSRVPVEKVNTEKSATQENDVRFLETEIIRALKNVRDVVELVFVLDHVIRATLGLGLGRATRKARSHALPIFRAIGFGFFLTIPYTGHFSVCWESFCTPINPPPVQDVAAGETSAFESSMRNFRRANFIKNSWSSFSLSSLVFGRPFSFSLPLSFFFFLFLPLPSPSPLGASPWTPRTS